MNVCSNKVWLTKGSLPGDPAHRKRVLKKVSTQPMKILTFWNLPHKKVSKSKRGFFKMDTSVRLTKDPDPAGSGLNRLFILNIVSANNP
jgi:hypothetical protein